MTRGDESANHTLPRAATVEEGRPLRELAAPPGGMRIATMLVMALTVVAALGTLVSIRGDLRYFAAARAPAKLGDITQVKPAALSPNTYVYIEGNPMLAHTVAYRRAISGVAYVVFPLAGQRNVFVEMTLEDAKNPEVIASRGFAGRLVTFGDLGGRFSDVRKYLSEQLSLPVTSETFLVRVGETPDHYAWALGLALLCLALIAINVFMFIRWYRPLPVPDDHAPA